MSRPECHVLVVEDEPRMRDLLSDVVPEMGFPVTTARSAEEALRAMSKRRHEIAILDLQLPGMHGMDLFDALHRRWPNTQVIVLTGFGDLESARRAIRLNVVDFLTKPCHLCDIEVALDRARRRIPMSEPPGASTCEGPADDPSTLEELERRAIVAALSRSRGNRSRAAEQLGISRRTLHYRLAQYRATPGS